MIPEAIGRPTQATCTGRLRSRRRLGPPQTHKVLRVMGPCPDSGSIATRADDISTRCTHRRFCILGNRWLLAEVQNLVAQAWAWRVLEVEHTNLLPNPWTTSPV